MLYPASIILLIANLIALVLSALRPSLKWLRWWPVGLAVVALLQLVIDGFYQTLILVYVITAILIVIGLYQWKVPATKTQIPVSCCSDRLDNHLAIGIHHLSGSFCYFNLVLW